MASSPSRPVPPTTAESGFAFPASYPLGAPDTAAIGDPGGYPYTRHAYRDGYRARPWSPSLYAGFGSPRDANARFHLLLSQGNGRASIAFDLPTQLGLDSDDPEAQHDVGRVGVAVDSLADMEQILDGIPLGTTPVTMNMNAMGPVVVAMLAVVARRQGVDLADLRGTISNDILHEFASRGLYLWDLPSSMRLTADTADYVLRHMPGFFAFNVRGVLLHEAGADPVQEVGYSLAIARAYVDDLVARGHDVEAVAGKLSLFYATSPRFLEDAAKLRAARRLWARVMREEYGTDDRRAEALRMTAVACAGSHFMRERPELNLVRSTLGVVAAALGGVQTMVGTAYDEAYDIPSEHAQELALGVQQIVQLESDVCGTADPIGGAAFLEDMTDRIEQGARRLMDQVAQDGGIVRALADQGPQTAMQRRAYDMQREIERGERLIVGHNVHRDPREEAADIGVFEPSQTVVAERHEALQRLRSSRDDDRVRAALADLAASAKADGSVMPAVEAAVEAYATVGEMRQALTDGFDMRTVG